MPLVTLAFSDLQDKVLAWLDEGDHTTANPVTLARIKEALIEADVERATSQRWPFMVQEPPLTFPLQAGVVNYTLDASFHIPVYFWNQTRKSPLRQYPEDDVPSRDITSQGLIDDYFVASPQYGAFLLRNQKIKLLWTPVATDTIEYQFYQLPTEMSANTDLPNIPYPYSRVLIYDALLSMVAYNEDIEPAKIQLWQDRQTKWQNNLLAAHDQENNQWTMTPTVQYIPRD